MLKKWVSNLENSSPKKERVSQQTTSNAHKKIMQGAIVLSLAGIVVKILSAIYRVPFQNLVGNTGFYVYQQVYPIYGIGMTFALSGFPVFLSHMIAQEKTFADQKVVLQQSFVILTLLGVVCFSGLFFGSYYVALLMGDIALMPVVKMVSWMFLVMPFLVIGRGYFQGIFYVIPTAISQIVEQVVRISVILFVAFIYSIGGFSLYQMGKWAMFSATLAALSASLVLYWYVKQDWQQHLGTHWLKESMTFEKNKKMSIKELAYRFFTEGGTICLISSMLVLFQLIDSFTAYKTLLIGGVLPEVAKGVKGVYDRGQPLVQLGMVVGIGFTSSYLPMLAKSYAECREIEFRRNAKSLVKMTYILALMATIGMMAILPRLNHVLFGDISGNGMLGIYIVSILVASMIIACNGILQSTQQYKITLISLSVGLLVKVILNKALIVYMGLAGASIATVVGLGIMYIVMLSLSSRYLQMIVKSVIINYHIIGIALMVFSSVYISDFFIQEVVPHGITRIGDFVIVLVEVLIGAVVFIALALYKRIFTTREWLMIPKGKEFLRYINNK